MAVAVSLSVCTDVPEKREGGGGISRRPSDEYAGTPGRQPELPSRGPSNVRAGDPRAAPPLIPPGSQLRARAGEGGRGGPASRLPVTRAVNARRAAESWAAPTPVRGPWSESEVAPAAPAAAGGGGVYRARSGGTGRRLQGVLGGRGGVYRASLDATQLPCSPIFGAPVPSSPVSVCGSFLHGPYKGRTQGHGSHFLPLLPRWNTESGHKSMKRHING